MLQKRRDAIGIQIYVEYEGRVEDSKVDLMGQQQQRYLCRLLLAIPFTILRLGRVYSIMKDWKNLAVLGKKDD